MHLASRSAPGWTLGTRGPCWSRRLRSPCVSETHLCVSRGNSFLFLFATCMDTTALTVPGGGERGAARCRAGPVLALPAPRPPPPAAGRATHGSVAPTSTRNRSKVMQNNGLIVTVHRPLILPTLAVACPCGCQRGLGGSSAPPHPGASVPFPGWGTWPRTFPWGAAICNSFAIISPFPRRFIPDVWDVPIQPAK